MIITYNKKTSIWYSKDKVDKYINNVKKKLNKVYDMIKYLIPTDLPCTIVYLLGRLSVDQFTEKNSRTPTIVQDTVDSL